MNTDNKPLSDIPKEQGDEMGARKIVEENFEGFNDIIQDEDLRHFYKSLIVTCIEEYSSIQTAELMAEVERLKAERDEAVEALKTIQKENLNYSQIYELACSITSKTDRVGGGN